MVCILQVFVVKCKGAYSILERKKIHISALIYQFYTFSVASLYDLFIKSEYFVMKFQNSYKVPVC